MECKSCGLELFDRDKVEERINYEKGGGYVITYRCPRCFAITKREEK